MDRSETHIVTGAYGYSGKYIAERLLKEDLTVRTITNSPNRENQFNGKVKASLYNFDNPEKLAKSLRGASVLYNTYWVRFDYKNFSHTSAVENTLTLFNAAKEAGVKRIVHTSITNPDENSHLDYFSGKAKLERALKESGLSYAILRPTVLFGKEDILMNNIAWLLSKFPVFPVFGDGKYRLQPIYVEDFAKLAVEQGRGTENVVIDAIGPETFTYHELVKTIGTIKGKRRPVVSIPPALGYFLGSLFGKILDDIMITHDEIEGLMADLLYTDSSPSGQTKLTEWMSNNADILGAGYSSELARRKNLEKAYDKL